MKAGELVKLKKTDLINGEVEMDGKKIIIPQSIIEESRAYLLVSFEPCASITAGEQ